MKVSSNNAVHLRLLLKKTSFGISRVNIASPQHLCSDNITENYIARERFWCKEAWFNFASDSDILSKIKRAQISW